jgi:hypothetical protein
MSCSYSVIEGKNLEAWSNIFLKVLMVPVLGLCQPVINLCAKLRRVVLDVMLVDVANEEFVYRNYRILKA